MRKFIFWHITSSSPVKFNWCFGRTCSLHLQGRRVSQTRSNIKQIGSACCLLHVRWLSPDCSVLYVYQKTELFIAKAARISNPFLYLFHASLLLRHVVASELFCIYTLFVFYPLYIRVLTRIDKKFHTFNELRLFVPCTENLSLDTMSSQIHQSHILTPISTVPSLLRLSLLNRILRSDILTRIAYVFSSLPCVLHLRPSNPSCNNILWRLKIIMLLIMQFSPISCYIHHWSPNTLNTLLPNILKLFPSLMANFQASRQYKHYRFNKG
jgi:hypothetical protein